MLGAGCVVPSSKDEAARAAALANAEAEPEVEPAALQPTPAVEPAPPVVPTPPPWRPRPEDQLEPHQRVEHPEALAGFFAQLARIDDGAPEVARVVHLGASMIGADDLPSVLRTKFQTRFGDGGAGLVLLARYMPNYLHHWVDLDASGWDHCYIAYLCKKDGFYGLGGTTFWSDGGARTRIATRDHELGGAVSKLEVWYAADTRGGRLEVRVDDGEREIIETRGDTLEDRYHAIDVESGPHAIRLRALGGGRVRGYGVVFETDGPGVTWEQFSMLGAFTKRMLAWDPAHIAGQIAHRDPALVVFTYGGNDTRRVATGTLTHEEYVGEYLEAVQRVRAGKPEMSCLITAMIDRGKSLQYTIEAEHVELIVGAQREVAQKAGCAFFDSFTAMGGAGSMRKWRAQKPPLASGDLKHLNHRGRVVLGGWIYDAVIDAYVDYRTGGEPTAGGGPAKGAAG